jgi:hypothetical protein
VAGVKIDNAREQSAPTESRRGGALGWLREPSLDTEPMRRFGRAAAANLTPAGLWRKHRLFSLLVLLSIVPRVLAALAFRPAELIPDSFSYMQEGVHLSLGTLRPAGYPILLRVLEPFHSLLLVTSLQHVMGIAVAAIVYSVLRAKGLPGWGASLAAVPTLFDPRQIWLESAILPDTLFGLVILVAIVILLTDRAPKAWQCALSGLLMAWASILRGNGAPVIVAIVIFMLVRRVGWRAFVAGVAAFALPLLAYVGLFHSDYGQYNITDSTGMFLWSRTMSFANCAVIKPPADLLPLCPDAQPLHGPAHAAPWSEKAVVDARSPADYLWASGAWWRHDAHPGINAYNNKLAMQFAVDAIKAQPLDYLKVTSRDVMLTFLATDRPQNILGLSFTTKPDLATLSSSELRYLREYAHAHSNTRAVQPYAYLLFFYQLPVYFPGWAYFLVIVAGLVGVARSWWRRRRPEAGLVPWATVALPWAVAVIIIVVAPALHEYLYRYAISAVPVACLAAGLAFVRNRPQPALAGMAAHVYPPQVALPPQEEQPSVAGDAAGTTAAVAAPEAEAAATPQPAAEPEPAPEPTKLPESAASPGPAASPEPTAGASPSTIPEPAGVITTPAFPGQPDTLPPVETFRTEEAPDFDADTDPGWPSPLLSHPHLAPAPDPDSGTAPGTAPSTAPGPDPDTAPPATFYFDPPDEA